MAQLDADYPMKRGISEHLTLRYLRAVQLLVVMVLHHTEQFVFRIKRLNHHLAAFAASPASSGTGGATPSGWSSRSSGPTMG